MKAFDYVRPATVREAVAAASEPGAAYLASGTNLLDLMKGGVTRPNLLVDVTRLPGLDRIERLPDASHWVQNDDPERVNLLLRDFFQNLPNSRSTTQQP